MDRDTPTFNLKAVVQETGIKPDTLRAWERRYGLPEPERSSGGHRLYSQRDIEILQWLMARQDEGLTISRAVDLWRTLETEGQDPLRSAEYGLRDANELVPIEGEAIDTLREHWIDACLAFDERTTERVLTHAFALYPVELVCREILQEGLREIGQRWYEGTVSVQQEHFATALASRRVDALLGATPPPTRQGRILTACPPMEEHTLPLMLLTLFLRRRGWETVYLGANVPLERLEESVDRVRPRLVILTAQRLQAAANLHDMATLLQSRKVPVAFGGRVFNEMPSLQRLVPGHYLGESLEDALETVEELITLAPTLPEPDPVDPAYQNTLSRFREVAPRINASVAEKLAHNELSNNRVASANLDLAQDLSAALRLGDVALLQNNMEWLTNLLDNHAVSRSLLDQYLDAYYDAAREHLADQGDLVLSALAPHLPKDGGQAARNGNKR